MESGNEGMWWKQRSDWVGEERTLCSFSHTRQALLVVDWDSGSTSSNTSEQKGCPHPPLGLEWCLGREGGVQWRVGLVAERAVGCCTHVPAEAEEPWVTMRGERRCAARRGSRVEIRKGPEVVPWGSGRSFVLQSSAGRSRWWEAPSHRACHPLPPLPVLSSAEGRASFPPTAE